MGAAGEGLSGSDSQGSRQALNHRHESRWDCHGLPIEYEIEQALGVSYTLHPTPCTLHPTPYTLHPTPYTLHPTPESPEPEAPFHPQTEIRNPKP